MKLTIQHQKGVKSTFLGQYTQKSNSSIDVKSNLKIHNQKAISLSASTDISLATPKIDLTVVHGNDQYAMMASGEYQPYKYGKIISHVQYPARKVVVELEGGKKEGQCIGKVGVSWDAINDADKRVLLECISRVNTLQDFTIFTNLEYPGMKIAGELRNLIKANYNYKTSASVSWNPQQRIFVEVDLLDNRKKYRGQTEATLSVQTPFKNFEEYQLKASSKYKKSNYEVQGGVTWSKGKTFSVTASTKYPPMIEDLNLVLKVNTPFKKVGNPLLILQNQLSPEKSQSGSLKLDWGKNQYIHIETHGETTAYELYRREFTRNIGFSSSILNYEKVIFNITHEDNTEKFRSQAVVTHNNDRYLYKISMDHKLTGWQLDSKGTFDIQGPYDTMVLVWSHKNTDRDIRSTSEIKWGKRQTFTAEFTGDIQTIPNHKITGRFQMNVPATKLRRVDAIFEHENKIGFIKTLGKIVADRENIGTFDLKYGRQVGKADLDLKVNSKYMDDFRVKSFVHSATMPIKSGLEIQWHEAQTIAAAFTHSDVMNHLESKLILNTPFKQAKRIVIDASHKLKGIDWVAEGSVNYAPMQTITVGGIYNIQTEKKARVYITSPFPAFKRLETGVFFQGSWIQFKTNFDFEIDPLVKKITASSEWSYNKLSTKGSVRLDTPFQEYPYMQANLLSQYKVTSRESSLILEYLPTQKIELTGSYVTKPNNLEGTFTLKTPRNKAATISYRQNGDINAFDNHAEVKYDGGKKIIIDTTFGIKPKVYGTFHMESPMRGYKKVDFQFNHEGKTWKNLRTQFLYGTNADKIEVETIFDIVGALEAKAMIKTPFPNLKIAEASFSHDGSFPNLRTNIRGIFNNTSIETNLEMSHTMKITGGKINLSTTFPNAKFAEIAFNHEGSYDNFQTHVETTYNDIKCQSDTVFSHSADLTAFTHTLLAPPIKGWEKTMITFNRDGPFNNFKSTGEILYKNQKISGTYNHNVQRGDVATTATLITPYTNDIMFKLDQNQRKRGFTTNVEISMGTDNEWKCRTNYKLRNNELVLDIDETLIMAGEKYTTSFKIDHAGVPLAFSTKVSGKYQSHTIGTSFDFNGQSLDDIHASVKVDSSFKGYTEMDLVATHKKNNNEYKSEVKASMEKKHQVAVSSTITAEIPKMDINVGLQTSFKGYESASFIIKTDRPSEKYIGEAKVTYPGGNTITAEGRFKAQLPVVDANIQVATPYKGFESFGATVKSTKSTSDFEVRYGDNKKITSSMSQNINFPTINVNWAVTTSMNTVSAEFNNKKVGNRYTTTISTNINGKKSSTRATVSVDLPSVDVEVTMKNSPLKEYYSSNFPSDLTLVLRNFGDMAMANTDIYLTVDGTEKARLKSSINTGDLLGDVTITMPDGKRISISHQAQDKWTRTLDASWTFDAKNKMLTSSRCKVNLPDVDCSISMESSYNEDIQVTVVNTVTESQISSSTSASYGNAMKYNAEMTLSPVPSNILFSLKLITPHEGFTNSEISFTQTENRKTYNSKLIISSDKISTITWDGKQRMQGLFDFDYFSRFTSDFEPVQSLQLSISSQKQGEEYIMQVETYIDPVKKLSIDAEVIPMGDSGKAKLHLAIETPYKELQSFKYKEDQTLSKKNKNHMRSTKAVLVQYNGDTYFDTDEEFEILIADDWLYDYQINFRHPRQMEYSFYGKKDGNLFTGKSSVNWNKEDVNSNIEMSGQATIANNKDLHNQVKLEAIHATRTVGLDAILHKTSNMKRSNIIVIWDKDNGKKAGFDLHQDGQKYTTKIVTPSRSIEMVNENNHGRPVSYSENTLFWDADSDRDKKAAIRVTSSGKLNIDHKIDIKLPTFNKVCISISNDL